MKHINQTVRNLLNKLVEDHPSYRWESMVVYADGREKTILEILIYAESGGRQTGRIIYQVETGDIHNYYYRGYPVRDMESIVDLLLDILNIVQAQEDLKPD